MANKLNVSWEKPKDKVHLVLLYLAIKYKNIFN